VTKTTKSSYGKWHYMPYIAFCCMATLAFFVGVFLMATGHFLAGLLVLCALAGPGVPIGQYILWLSTRSITRT
jgi:hypothetical protein